MKTVPQTQKETSRPLTEPADLMALIGRFCATCVLGTLTVAFFWRGERLYGVVLAIVTLILQVLTVRLWRHLREERAAKVAEQEKAA
jgi:hypothetical protein